eukprot:5528058-Amphidinium_carterae.1
MPTVSSVSTPSSRSRGMHSSASLSQMSNCDSNTPSAPPPSHPPYPPQPPAVFQPPAHQPTQQDSTPRSRSKYSSSTSRSHMSSHPPHPPQPPTAAVTSMSSVQPPMQQIMQQDIMDAFDRPPLPLQAPGVDVELPLAPSSEASSSNSRSRSDHRQQAASPSSTSMRSDAAPTPTIEYQSPCLSKEPSTIDYDDAVSSVSPPLPVQQSLCDDDDDDDEQPSRAAASFGAGAAKRQKSNKGANKRQKTDKDDEQDHEFLWMTCRDPEHLTLMLKSVATRTPLFVCPSSSVHPACCEGQQCTVVDAENSTHGDAFIALCFLDGCFSVPQLASTYGDRLPTGDMLEITWPTRTDSARDMTEWCTETLSNEQRPVMCKGDAGELQYLAAVKKTHDNLTAAEELQHATEVTASKKSEWHKLLALDCFRMMNKEDGTNVLDGKWILRWKAEDPAATSSARKLKARITLRGFREWNAQYETYAATASRVGQRAISSLAAASCGAIHLVSYDISSAFAQGLTFSELAQPGEEARAVQLMVSASDAELIREFEGWSSFDHHRHILSLQKPVYGLKDAPRSWQKRLTTLLTQAHLRPCLMDSQLFVITAQDLKEAGRSELIEKTPFENQVQAGMTAHVDDLKLATTTKLEAFLKQHLEGYIGKLTEQRERFVHVGIMHQVDSTGGVYMHQNAYVQQIQVTPLGHLKQKQAEERLDSEDQQIFNSVLGAISWLQQARPDLASQTQALQRRAHAPRKIDLVRAHQLVKYAKAHPSGLYYPAFETTESDSRLLAFTDSSFQARPDDNKALSIRGTAILLAASGIKQGALKTPVHLLECQSTKHKQVVRSTFAAELGAMVDSIDRAVGIQLLLSELFFDKQAKEARTRMAEQSHGQTVPRLIVAVDHCRCQIGL